MTKSLQEKIAIAADLKPSMGEPCNHCGWCCLIEVCPTGKIVTGSSMVPCSMLIEVDGRHYCYLANSPERKNILGIGTGCCAITIEEQLAQLMRGELPENLKRQRGSITPFFAAFLFISAIVIASTIFVNYL